MRTPEQLYAHQSKLPPLRSYFVVWERPHGSFTWTQLGGLYTERDAANNAAKMRVDSKNRPICDCVVSESKLARMPHQEGSEPVAVLVHEGEPETLYFGKGHARVAAADDDHHAMMNGPRIAQSLGLNNPVVMTTPQDARIIRLRRALRQIVACAKNAFETMPHGSDRDDLACAVDHCEEAMK